MISTDGVKRFPGGTYIWPTWRSLCHDVDEGEACQAIGYKVGGIHGVSTLGDRAASLYNTGHSRRPRDSKLS